MLLLHANSEGAPTSLEVILELLMQMQWRLNLNKCSKLGVVVLDVEPILFVFFDESMLPTNGNIMDANICLMTTAQFNLINIVEINDVQLLLLFMVILRRINLERLYY